MTPSKTLTSVTHRLATIAALTAFALAGCSGTGMQAQTNAQYQPGIGANVRTGSIQVYNALAVDNGDGTATFSAAIINRDKRAAKLRSATATASDGSKVDVTTAPAIVGAGKVFNTGKAAAVIFTDKKLEAGGYVNVKLSFDGGRSVSVNAPVVARNATYDDVASGPGGETAKPTPKPTPSAEADVAKPAPAAPAAAH